MGILFDYRNGLRTLAYKPGPGTMDEAFEAVRQKHIQPYLKSFGNCLQDHKFLFGDKVAVPDFFFYELMHTTRLMFPNIFDTPEQIVFRKYLENFCDLPGIKQYIQSDKCIQRQVFNVSAVWQGPSGDEFTRG